MFNPNTYPWYQCDEEDYNSFDPPDEMTYDDIVAEAREMDEEEATELAHDALQEALAQAWESLLAVPAYVERYRRDGHAFDQNDYDC